MCLGELGPEKPGRRGRNPTPPRAGFSPRHSVFDAASEFPGAPRAVVACRRRTHHLVPQPLILGPHEILAVAALEPADDEVPASHILEMLDERVIDRGAAE